MAKARRKTISDVAADVANDTGGVLTEAPPQSAAETEDLDRDRVAQRAYELFLERGGGHGQAMDDWLAAERELLRDRSGSSRNNS